MGLKQGERGANDMLEDDGYKGHDGKAFGFYSELNFFRKTEN